MLKLKKRLTVIVSVLLVFAVLGSTAAIFVGTRTNNNEQDVITSPVGFLEGTTPGKGQYADNSATWVFAENDSTIFEKVYYEKQNLASNKKLGLYSTVYGESTTSPTANLVADTDGNGYVELTNPDSGTSAAVLLTQSLNGIKSYTARAGTYVTEFDIMIPEEVDINKPSSSEDWWFLSLCLSNLCWTNQADFSRIFFFDSNIDGYYSITNTSNTVSNGEFVKFKYGEWYRFRIEYKLDNSSTNYECKLIVNDVDIWSFTAKYWAVVCSYIDQTYGPTYFRFVTRGYANGLKVCVDNLYFGKK